MMKSVTLPIEKLFYALGAIDAEEDIPIPVIPDLFVSDPFGDRTRINFLVKKTDNKIKLKFGDISIHCGEKHVMSSSNGLGYAIDINDAYNVITDDYIKVDTKTKTGSGPVYDIAIDDPHLYVTPNGFVHHNTTLAKALCNEMGLDYLLINASESGNIDTIRTTIRAYASTMSFTSKYKVVILDEADYLNACFAIDQKIKVIESDKVVERSISELLDKEFQTISYDFESGEIIFTKAIAFETTEKEVFRVTMEDGSEILCTEDHPFFTESGDTAYISGGELFTIL